MPFILMMLLFSGLQQQPAPRFEAQTIDSTVQIGYGLALSDVDGDGKTDILLADKKQFVWYRNGDWKKFVMIENLTESDNVCIAARDLDGDGKCEVAVGAQWNPSETSDTLKSGSVHYLLRPSDPTNRWTAIELHHEPTIHRMRWVKAADGKYFLVVAPLHGRGNAGGNGEGVRLIAYEFPGNVRDPWKMRTLENSMHLMHNIEPVESGASAGLYVAGKEGVRRIPVHFNTVNATTGQSIPGMNLGTGELRMGKLAKDKSFIATVEPMHGNQAVVYLQGQAPERILLDEDLREGHALAAADFNGSGKDQVVVGWRLPNKSGKVGIRLFRSMDALNRKWEPTWVDDNGMACEDLQVADLDGDGRPEIVASGRATKNLKIYWNKTGK